MASGVLRSESGQFCPLKETIITMAKRIHWTQTREGKAKLAARRERKLHSNGRQPTSLSHEIALAASSTPAADESESKPAEPKPLGLKVRNAVRDIMDTFLAFAHSFTAVNVKRDEFAPRFARTFEMWREETGGSLAAFCRMFDETVPESFKEYRSHSTYTAADYLLRKSREAVRDAAASKRGRKRKKPASPRNALVRLVSSILPLFAEGDRDTLVNAMAKRLNWSEDQARGVITSALDESPIITIKAPRGVHVEGELKVSVAPETTTRGKAA